jgi:hypothetical protein
MRRMSRTSIAWKVLRCRWVRQLVVEPEGLRRTTTIAAVVAVVPVAAVPAEARAETIPGRTSAAKQRPELNVRVFVHS